MNGGWIYAKTFVRYGSTASISATSQIYPLNTVQVTLTDNDLNSDTNNIQSYTVRDSNIVNKEYQDITVTKRSKDDSVFIGNLNTRYGYIAGADNIGYIYVHQNDTLRVGYKDTMQLNGGSGTWKSAITKVLGANWGRDSALVSIYPGNNDTIFVTDYDLNRNSSSKESYKVYIYNKATNESDSVTVTERSFNDSVFIGTIQTQYGKSGGTNNDGIINAKVGDTLLVFYHDTVTYDGAPGLTDTAITTFKGGHTASLTATPSILPGVSMIDTLIDQDLNKDTTRVETYFLRDTSSNGQIDTVLFTETGIKTGIFTATIPTTFGTTKGSNGKNVTFNTQANDTIVISYLDSLQGNGGSATIIAKTAVIGGHTANLSGTTSILPGASIIDTLIDQDLNKDTTRIETYFLRDTSSNGQIDTVLFTETGIKTGIFTATIPTTFGTTKGSNGKNVTFNAQAGDTLYLTYKDTLASNGGSGTTKVLKTPVIGGNTATLTGTLSILPGASIIDTLIDQDLNKDTTRIETYFLRDTSSNGQIDTVLFTETGIKTGIFTATIPTTFGTTKGSNGKNVTFNAQAGDTLYLTYKDTLASNGGSGTTKVLKTAVVGGHTATLSGTASILPGASIIDTLTDQDLNKNATAAETYFLRDTSSNGQIDTVLFTETGVNTGIFTATIPTTFGTTKGSNGKNVTFNAQANDTIVISYLDSVKANGGSATIIAKTAVIGGHTANLSGTASIIPGASIIDTLTDQDLNKNATVAETYFLRDTSSNGQIDTVLFTETGINTGIFTATIPTTFGTTKGSNGKNVTFNVQANDTIYLTYKDTLASNGGPGSTIVLKTAVVGGHTAILKGTASILPGASIIDTLTDQDLNKNATVAETYFLRDTSSNGQIDTVLFTETGVNTGIFTASIPTTFGTTKGSNGKNVTFNTQANDTIYLTYKDTLASNGGPGSTMVIKTAVVGGHTAILKGTASILPGASIIDTLTDQDLNKNATVAETYSLRDTSSNGQIDTVLFTETGVNTGIFTATIPTTFGTTKGSNGKNVTLTAQASDAICLTYVDTLATNGGPGSTLRLSTNVIGGHTATMSGTISIIPGASIIDTLTDQDLNKNATVAETYSLRDTSSNGQIDTVLFTETGVNTGIFTATIPTKFGTTKGSNGKNVTLTAQASDAICLTYVDTLAANGGPGATLRLSTTVTGGHNGTISANPVFMAATDTSTFTLTDADLNKDPTKTEVYYLLLKNSSSEKETIKFTETGINSGVFTGLVRTISGIDPGPSGDTIFTVQPGDSIVATYHDSLTVTGDTANVTASVKIGSVVFSSSSKSVVNISINTGSAIPPDTMAYTIKVKNTGTVKSTRVAVTDTIPLGMDVLTGTLPGSTTVNGRVLSFNVFNLNVNDSLSLQYSLRIDSSIQTGVPATNTAHIIADGVDQKLTATFTPVNQPQMTLTKAVDKSHAKPGDTLTYTIVYKNIGTSNATFLTVTDPNPNYTNYVANSVTLNGVAKTDAADGDEVTYSGGIIQINVGTIIPGQTGTITFKVTIK